jgi:DNA adenine methylase
VQMRVYEVDLLELGYSTFFLNRTNRSGIIHSAGVIGGLRQRGDWKLGARFSRDKLIARIELIADYRDRIMLYNQDALALLRLLSPTLPARTLVYLDPPYYRKGTRRLYANYYEHSDHANIAKVLAHTRHRWVVSYDDVPEVCALYNGYRRRMYRLPYSASRHYSGGEVMFFSDDLVLPRVRYGMVGVAKPEQLTIAMHGRRTRRIGSTR